MAISTYIPRLKTVFKTVTDTTHLFSLQSPSALTPRSASGASAAGHCVLTLASGVTACVVALTTAMNGTAVRCYVITVCVFIMLMGL